MPQATRLQAAVARDEGERMMGKMAGGHAAAGAGRHAARAPSTRRPPRGSNVWRTRVKVRRAELETLLGTVGTLKVADVALKADAGRSGCGRGSQEGEGGRRTCV
jgi:hypothetical protein